MPDEPVPPSELKAVIRKALGPEGSYRVSGHAHAELEAPKMKCTVCGRQGMHTAREAHLYRECGLPNVVLVGVNISRCGNCGEYEVEIPNIPGLHKLIATALSEKPVGLSGDEIRFIRKYLGFSGVDFAKQISVTPETVSRWENGGSPIGAQAERLVRFMVKSREPVASYPAQAPTAIDRKSRPELQPVRVEFDSSGEWKLAA